MIDRLEISAWKQKKMKRIFSALHRYAFYYFSVSFPWFTDHYAFRLVRHVPPHLRPALLCAAAHCHRPRSTAALHRLPRPCATVLRCLPCPAIQQHHLKGLAGTLIMLHRPLAGTLTMLPRPLADRTPPFTAHQSIKTGTVGHHYSHHRMCIVVETRKDCIVTFITSM